MKNELTAQMSEGTGQKVPEDGILNKIDSIVRLLNESKALRPVFKGSAPNF